MPRRKLFTVTLTLLLAAACSPVPTPTPFRPPTLPPPLIEPTLLINSTREAVVVQSTPITTISIPPTVDTENCSNDLTFVQDLTIPDNSLVTYGAAIDKQWLVENSGTCDWNADYRL
ncbi:MAG TPA: hypothetical protein VFO91_02750, partial [Anaerolineales bacterium]|nr:hypothetical protein [Anaerolineales bacterium]